MNPLKMLVILICLMLFINCSSPRQIASELNPEYPLKAQVDRFLERQGHGTQFISTRLSSNDYLKTIHSIIQFWAQHQNSQGAIIDPYEQAERQYSTPAFALCGAVLLREGWGNDNALEDHTIRAMDHSIRTLVAGKAADRHGDFFTIKLMYAYRILKNIVPPPKIAEWTQLLREMHPDTVYQSTLSKRNATQINNWNLVATSGEFLRNQLGLTDQGMFVAHHLPLHIKRITEHGMYIDPHNPMAYDLFARYHLLLILANGYEGPGHERLLDLSLRGAWTSLFLQSSLGEVPCGFRSAHHQWNEALECAIFEIYASHFARLKKKNIAGTFKRGAHLALESIGRWVRPGGELWIVKNRHDPAKRWGYESYSFHSQYNLLAASMLAVAYLHADPTIAEQPAPADIGGFCISIDDGANEEARAKGFHKTIANARGYYLEIERAGHHAHNPTGLLRLHRRQGNKILRGISDGSVNSAKYGHYDWNEKDIPFTHSICPGWWGTDGKWHKLADFGETDLLAKSIVEVIQSEPDQVEFYVRYTLEQFGCNQIIRHYQLTPTQLTITDSLTGAIERMRSYFTFLQADGQDTASVAIDDSNLSITMDNIMQTYQIIAPSTTVLVKDLSGAKEKAWVTSPFRNGTLGAAAFEVRGNQITYQIGLN